MNTVVREPFEWCDIWMKNGIAESMPRTLIIGDSISRGLYPFADLASAGEFSIDRLSTSRSINDPCFFREVNYVTQQYDYCVIHVNNGLHGWHIEEAEQTYAEGISSLLNLLKDNCPKAQIIWGMTTPVTVPSKPQEFCPEKNPRVLLRNEIAFKVAKEHSIPVNDLYSLVSPHPEYSNGDGYHYSEEGCKVLGENVSAVIQQYI